jgi:alpha-D-glucose phosphate-specific phosphoglucomutase
LETLGGKVSVPTIRFGTAGWRALIARDFTFANVRLASQAVTEYLKAALADPRSPLHGREPNLILAHDCRFLGRQFALAAAEVFAANGLTPLLCNRDTPTPVLAFTIGKRKAIGGINITASHNPPEYSGFKFSRHDGAGAPPEVTRAIEETIARLQRENWSFKSAIVGTFECKNIDPQADYFRQIRKLVQFSTIRKARLKIAVDLMHGCGHGYLDTLLAEAGAALTVLHAEPNPLFGGHPPEPTAAHLTGMIALARARKVRLGLATDGDADRFGVIDSDGTWITPNQVLALTLYHLAKHRGWKGAAVRTVVTSHQVDAVAARFGIRIYEVPVGFKYIGAVMEREPVIVGGEESGGLSVRGHVPEKDGILACLLMAELVAAAGKSLGAILKEITKLGGAFFTDRINIHVDPHKREELLSRLSAGLSTIGPFPVEKFITTDGFKFMLANGEWVAFRASGTEPVFRCYIEARSKKNLESLLAACRALLG